MPAWRAVARTGPFRPSARYISTSTPRQTSRPIAEDFDAAAFAETMRAAHVGSVNVFARCHHGYSYYPTTVGTIHPGLGFDLLGRQIEALHAAGIKAVVYVTIGWDDLAAAREPGWVVVNKDGLPNAAVALHRAVDRGRAFAGRRPDGAALEPARSLDRLRRLRLRPGP